MSRKWKTLPELIKSLRLTKAEVDAIVNPPGNLEDFIFDPAPSKEPRDYRKVDILLAAMKKDLH